MYHRTRSLWQAAVTPGGGGAASSLRPKHKFLLPPDTFLDRAVATLQGLWAHVTEHSARTQYETWVEQQVIQDAVLEQARHGNSLTMALFWNLQNPLWAKYQFRVQDFVQAVGPALENFQDTLGQLVLQMNRSAAVAAAANDGKDKDKKEEEEDKSEPVVLALWDLPKIGGENEWRQQAEQDPDSLAARLQKMVSDAALDDHYYGAKLFQALTNGNTSLEYVPGSGVVQSVALLNARVMEIDEEDKEEVKERHKKMEHPEFAASEGEIRPPAVAARMDVLYEITQQYRPAATTGTTVGSPLSTAGNYNLIQNDDSLTNTKTDRPAFAIADEVKNNEKASEEMSESDKETSASNDMDGATSDPKLASKDTAAAGEKKTSKDETISETTLAVAVLEGWLHGGPDKTLKWRIATIRDAYEFA